MSRTPSISWTPTHVTTADGAVLRCFVLEPAEADEHTPTVVMAHGWTLDHRSWEPVVAQLAGIGADGRRSETGEPVRVITYDQRGHGDSTLTNGGYRTGGETVRALGNDLSQVIAALVPAESPLVLAGHSMGGMTVMAFAGLHPDVLRERVRAVVLVGTSAGDISGLGIPGEVLAMKACAWVPMKPRKLVLPSSQRATSFGDDPNDEDVHDVCEQIGNTRLSTSGTYYDALRHHDEYAALQELQAVPVTIIAGTKDNLIAPSHARRLAEAMPTAELEMVEGAGHMLMYEATDTVTDAVRRALRS